MHPLYVVEQQAVVRVNNRRVSVEADGQRLLSAPLAHVSEVILMGNVEITTPAMKSLLRQGVDVVFLSRRGRYYGRLIGPESPHVELRRRQYSVQGDAAFSTAIARRFVQAKIAHMRALLARHGRKREDVSIAKLVRRLDRQLTLSADASHTASLMGVEGAATAAYFRGLRSLVGQEWQFSARKRRPPPDPVNVLLSFGYTLLTHAARGAVEATGLDPYAGFLHAAEYNRPSLALDVVEEFRPLVDGVVLWCCNSRQIAPGDFTPGSSKRPVVMGDTAKRRFIAAYEKRLSDKFTHPLSGERVTLRRCLLAQARQVAAAVRSGRPDFTPMGFR